MTSVSMPFPSNEQQPKTVFVIGADASKEVNLPIGSEFKKLIAKALNIRFEGGHEPSSGDYEIYEALRSAAKQNNPPSRDINAYLGACWRIRDSMPLAISIDNFIDAHQEDKKIELCGKLAIVKTILQAEAKSSLYVSSSNINNKLNFEKLENTWFNTFVQLLTENCSRSSISKRLSSVVLVIFNYDRCVEHFLYHALQNYYSISATQAAAFIKHNDDISPLWHGWFTSLDERISCC